MFSKVLRKFFLLLESLNETTAIVVILVFPHRYYRVSLESS